LTSDGTKTIDCHPTKESAEAQERAIQAEKAKDYAYKLANVELFEAGTHNGDKYTEKDLDDIVEAYSKQGFQAPLKAGHADTPGKPALGWIANLRRNGTRLIGDITDIPKEIYELIKTRGYDRVSSEIFWNLESAGKKYRRALKAVAILGADIPAVSTLTPLHKLFSGCEGTVKYYDAGGNEMNEQISELQTHLEELQAKIEAMSKGKKLEDGDADLFGKLQTQVATLEQKLADANKQHAKFVATQDELADAQKRIHALEEERRQNSIKDMVTDVKVPAFRPYIQALLDAATADTEPRVVKFSRAGKEEDLTVERVVKDLVVELNKLSHGLFKDYTHANRRNLSDDDIDYADRQAVSSLVDRKTREYMAKHSVKEYGMALNAVLEAEPDLKAAYSS